MRKLIARSLSKEGVVAVHVNKRGSITEITKANINIQLPKRGNLYSTLMGANRVVCL